MKIVKPGGVGRFPLPIQTQPSFGSMGDDHRIERATKTIGQAEGLFLDEQARLRMEASTPVYVVEYWKPVVAGTVGGLFWGNSTILPGLVGDEYFMTRGHFHAQRDRAEYYATVSGTGRLILMGEDRHAEVQDMQPGTAHYIPGSVAHRVANVGEVPLTFLACWSSDAGYDYETIDKQGFSVRVLRRDGRPEVVTQL